MMMSGRNCAHCGVRSTALCSALLPDTARELGQIVHRRRMQAGQVVYSGSQKAKSLAILISGVVKLINVKPDGRSQIVGLQFPSEFVGRPFDGPGGMIAEAATDVEICSFSGRAFETLMETHPDLEHALLQRTLQDLDSARDWMFMIARKTAEERVASLLLLIARHLQKTSTCDFAGAGAEALEPGEAVEFNLPLSRTEIAESLGLRLETVSRQFAQLKAQGVIATGRRRGIKIADMAELIRRGDHGPE